MKTAIILLLPFALVMTAHAGEVEVVKDIAYYQGKDADPIRHKLDLYLPKGQKDLPVMVFIHGGAWKKGSKNGFQKLGRTFAKHGVGTVVANYRLTPQVKHPEHIKDVARAFAWTYKNIAKYGGKADQIFVSGHSAGGHLVALLATDDIYLKAQGLSLANIKGAIPISGPLLVKNKEVFGDEESCRQASPLNHVTGHTPPFLFLYAEKDIPYCDKMTKAMVEAVRKTKGQADYQMFKGRNHGSIVGNIPNEGDPVAQAMLTFIGKHSGGQK
jgi:acetyl esterase/lipase